MAAPSLKLVLTQCAGLRTFFEREGKGSMRKIRRRQLPLCHGNQPGTGGDLPSWRPVLPAENHDCLLMAALPGQDDNPLPMNSDALSGGLQVAERRAGALVVRYCPRTWRIMIQGQEPAAIFLHANQVRPVVVGILHALKRVDKRQFERAVERIRQFLR